MTTARIIAVEDERIVAKDLRLRLLEMGYEVPAVAGSAREAFDLVREHRPNLVLMDIRLPGELDGIEAARIIRSDYGVPVIYVTAHADADTLQRASLSEAYGYILKPFEDRQVKATVEVALYKHAAEKKMRELQDQLHLTQRVAQLGNWELNLATGEISISEEARRLLALGHGEETITRENLFSKTDPGDRELLEASIERCLISGQPVRNDCRVAKHSVQTTGGIRVVRHFGELAVGAAGLPLRLVATVQDVTEHKSLEEKLRRSQKMEAIGQLAGGVAHDFNNLLLVIRGYTEMAMEEFPDDHPSRSHLEDVHGAAERAAVLTKQLLAFSSRQVMRPRVVSLNRLISDFESMLRRMLRENIEMRKVLAGDLMDILADPDQIEQVIMNLAVNARDAMPQGGQLTFETGNRTIEPGVTRPGLQDLAPGNYVFLEVSDTGVGIGPDVLPHLFEPFFTTKGPGEGTGLGLSTVYGIVKQHGGELNVETELGRGTCFQILLPATETTRTEAESNAPGRVEAGDNETILLIEDDRAVRTLTERMLNGQRYRVIAVEGGAQALDLLQKQSTNIDLIVSDAILPGVGGRELMDRIRALAPGAPLLLMSGYPGHVIAQGGFTSSELTILQKPFGLNELARRVREALERS